MKCNRTQEECTAPGVCLELGCQGKLQANSGAYRSDGSCCPPSRPQPDRLREGADKIRARLKEKREEYQDFIRHIHIRLREEDAHAIWDAGANLSEVSNYQDGLLYALAALGEAE